MLTIILESVSGAMSVTAYWDICYLVVSFFAFELILRIFFCQNPLKFFVDPLQLIDFFVISQDLIFIILLSTTSTTSVIGNGQNSNNGGSSGSTNTSIGRKRRLIDEATDPNGKFVKNMMSNVVNLIGNAPGSAPSGSSGSGGNGPAPPGGIAGSTGVSIGSTASTSIQKATKICRFLYVQLF